MSCARYLTAATALLLLAACSGNSVKSTLGLNRAAPDEFRVVARPPLSVPPQFDLRPPSNSSESPNQLPTSDQAQSMIFGSAAAPAAGATATAAPTAGVTAKKLPAASAADASFLKNAGADQADPHIRDELAEQRYAAQEQKDNSSWWDILSTNPTKKDPVVDAKKEAQRIQQDEASDQPVTTGDTPVKKQADTGVLGQLLGY